MSGYDKGDWRTWHPNATLFTTTAEAPSKRERNDDAEQQQPSKRPAVVVVRQPPRRPSDEAAMRTARDVVEALLYSSARGNRNDIARAQHMDAANHHVQRYVAHRQRLRQLPYATDVYRVRCYHKDRPLPLREFETNWARIDYYASILVQVWHRVLAHYAPRDAKHWDEATGVELLPRSVEMVCVFLGALYVMRQGHAVPGGQEVLPCDRFLAENLPQISDLDGFGYSRSDPR